MSPVGPVGGLPPVGSPAPLGPPGPLGPDGASAAGGVGRGERVADATPGFGAMLDRAVGGLSAQLAESERLTELAATGALPDPTMALVEVEKADLAFRTAVQVRNKLVEGWQELSRMNV